MNHNGNRYDDSPDSWPIRSSCGGGCDGGMSRMCVSQMPQRWDESWQPDYVPRASATPRMPMSRFYPDEQPDAVSPVFSRAGVERLVQPRYDDSPDSPNFYEPRIPQMMQSPGMPKQQRPWDDGPDSPNFYGQPVPKAMQPPGIQMQRPWDDGPDTDNFYRPGSSSPQEMPAVTTRPWDDEPDSPNFYGQPIPQTMQPPGIRMQRPWDNGPDTDNFYRRSSSIMPEYLVQQGMAKDYQPDYVPKLVAQIEVPRFHQNPQNYPDALRSVYSPDVRVSIQDIVNNLRNTFTKQPPDFQEPLPRYLFSENTPDSHFFMTQIQKKNHAVKYEIPDFTPSGDPKWDTIFHFRDDPVYIHGSLYGRSLADITSPNGCTGWLLGGNVLVTAAHCRIPRVSQLPYVTTQCPSLSARPGTMAGLPWAMINVIFLRNRNAIATDVIRNRLIDLGIPRPVVTREEANTITAFNTGIDPNFINQFHGLNFRTVRYTQCNLDTTFFLPSFGCRDIDVYQCGEFLVGPYTIGTSRPEYVSLKPSHVFGSVPLTREESSVWRKKFPVYAIHMNDLIPYPGSNSWTNLLSTKGVTSSILQSTLYDPSTQPHTRVFDLFIQTQKYPSVQGGSSGAPLMDLLTNRAIAVYKGQGGERADWTTLPQSMHNIAQQLRIPRFFSLDPSLDSTSNPSSTIFVGGRGGEKKVLPCPPGTAAAGIIGSTVESLDGSDAVVGNLGLVCLPFSRHYQFEKARVVAGGSIDTHKFPVVWDIFDFYINDYLSNRLPFQTFYESWRGGDLVKTMRVPLQQSFAMCPPNYFMTGLWAFPGTAPKEFNVSTSLIRSIGGIFCQRYSLAENEKTFVNPRIPIGRGGIFAWPSACPRGSIVSGININSGWYTDGFDLQCRRVLP